MTDRRIHYKYGARTVEYCPRWCNHDHYVYCCQNRSCFGGIFPKLERYDNGKPPVERKFIKCNWPEDEC